MPQEHLLGLQPAGVYRGIPDMSKTIAIFGGSFDPPHQDHARILRWLLDQNPHQPDEVWLLVAVDHAFGKELSAWEHRVEMVKEMVKTVWAEVDSKRKGFFPLKFLIPVTHVIHREEKYTVDILESLHREMPDVKFILPVGGDVIQDSSKWERWEDVQRLAQVIPIRGCRVRTACEQGYPTTSRNPGRWNGLRSGDHFPHRGNDFHQGDRTAGASPVHPVRDP